MANENSLKALEENRQATQFTSGAEAVAAGRKGGIKSGIARRKKFASRAFLKQMLACTITKTPEVERALKKIGADPEMEITVEEMGVLALLKKYMAGDTRVFDQIHEYLAEDPHTILEEKRMKSNEGIAKAIVNKDGFMEAMGAAVEEVFENGGDTPDALEDSE